MGGARFLRAWLAALLVAALGACGGGGGDSAAPQQPVTLAPPVASVALSGGPHVPDPFVTFGVEVDHMPAAGLHIFFDHPGTSIEAIYIESSNDRFATIRVQYASALTLNDGDYTEPITLRLCYDDPCTRQVQGSPVTITSTYTVRTLDAVSVDQRVVEVQGVVSQSYSGAVRLLFTLNGPVQASQVHVRSDVDQVAAGLFMPPTSLAVSPNQIAVDLVYSFLEVSSGLTETPLTVRLCYDVGCTRMIGGVPQEILLRRRSYVFGTQPPTDGTPTLAVPTRAALAHDVVDVEYSAALDALVFVTSWPGHALVVHDLATGQERSVALSRAPTSVSVSPSGLSAAVGHDARLSVIDLANVGQAGAVPRTFELSTKAADVVLDGAGHVVVTPSGNSGVVRMVDTATGNEHIPTTIFAQASDASIRLKPNSTEVYLANRSVSPDDIEHYTIDGATLLRIGDSPYHGDYSMCGNLWFNSAGSIIFTACGNTFRADADRTRDMTYAGVITLPRGALFQSMRITSLSQYEPRREVLHLEHDEAGCNPINQGFGQPCMSYLVATDSDSLARRTRHWLGPVDLDGVEHVQFGKHVFHRADGRRVLVSEVRDTTDPARQHYVSHLD